MHVWARRWARVAGITGTSLVFLAALPLQWSVPTTVLRGAIVGGALYLAVRLLAGLAGEAVLRAIVAEQLSERVEDEVPKGTEKTGAGRKAA